MTAVIRTAARILPALAIILVLAGAPPVGAAERVFELHIENGKLPKEKSVIRVKQGDVVFLRWTSDAPIILHLHGYDIERKVESGAVAEMAFTAHATGRFSVSVHGAADASKGGHHHHPLARLEVHPR
jgi:hypothetical protein